MKDLPAELQGEIEVLLKAGEHATAAAALRASGHPLHAARVYEQIFEPSRAMEAYELGGDIVSAARMALSSLDTAQLDRLVTLAIGTGKGDELLVHLKKAGRPAEEARVHASRGDLSLAADAHERAGHLDRAAAVLEEAGKVREAGLLLERHLEQQPLDLEAGLRLGRILARFGRHDDAVRTLQRALSAARAGGHADDVMVRAAPTLLMSFVQLGYPAAAREIIRRWGAAHAHAGDAGGGLEPPPASLEAFMQSDRVAALAAIQAAPRASQPPVQAPPKPDDADVLFGDVAIAGDAVELDAPHSERDERRDERRDARRDERPATIDDTLLLGGRYLLGEPLGGGGVGQVFRAFDAFSDKPVAVKIFGAQVLASDAVREFAREARAFAELRHPAVAQLIELNVAQGFSVTELVQASSFEALLARGGASGWLVPAAKALLDLLGTVHRTGLVHGGLKPNNVFVLEAGVRVVDVGAHRLLALRATETGGLAGVWPYLAPEQLFGAPASAQGDLYALAAMLFRALTGHAPFSRAEDDRRVAPPLASSINPQVDAAWSTFLARALAVDPAQRFTDADEMAGAMPPLPPALLLPAAGALHSAPDLQLSAGQAARYAKGGLVERPREGVRCYEGTDLALDRKVWLVEADQFAMLRPLVVCARLWRGVQPVYDVIPDSARVVLARDTGAPVELAALRAVPQGLARDLAGVSAALEWLHGQGWGVGGFQTERVRGSVGLRLRLAPAPLFVELTPEGRARDWASFGTLVDEAFELTPDPGLDGRARLLAMLQDRRLLDRGDLEALAAEAEAMSSWTKFFEAVVPRLVQGSASRVVARLVANVLRGA